MADSTRRKGDGPAKGPRDFAETLLKFAQPVIADVGNDEEALQGGLEIAFLVWNDEVMRVHCGEKLSPERAEELAAQLDIADDLGIGVIAALLLRKMNLFGKHRRLIRDFDLEPDPAGGKPRLRVRTWTLSEMKSWVENAGKPKPFIADMHRYVAKDGSLALVSRRAREIVIFLGAIVAAGSRAEAGSPVLAGVRCLHHPAKRPCAEQPIVRREAEGERIAWSCPTCGELGSVDNWRGTPWDHSDRQQQLSALAPGERLQVEISHPDRRQLERALGLCERASGALAAAQRTPRGWLLDASRTEIEDLAVAASSELWRHGTQSARLLRYFAIRQGLHEALGVTPAALQSAETAAVSTFNAYAYRSRSCGASRVEGCGAHRLSVVLRNVKPSVRRELVVRSDMTLEELHAVLQVAFGWSDSLEHGFMFEEQYWMREDQADALATAHSNTVRLLDVVPHAKDVLVYEYDLDHYWHHDIEVAELLPAERAGTLPRCAFGEGAAPPEEVGGPPGYEEFLALMADPGHPHHASFPDWVGLRFDPYAFDLETTNRLLLQLARWQE